MAGALVARDVVGPGYFKALFLRVNKRARGPQSRLLRDGPNEKWPDYAHDSGEFAWVEVGDHRW
eukprot:1868433-Alexandrium_andersonii.AAC.1